MRVNRFEIVSTFEIDPSIVLTCGPYIKGLEQKLRGKIMTINAPEGAPPPLPRLVLQLEDTILNVALDRFQITTKPPSHIAHDIQKAAQFAYQRSISILLDMKPANLQYQWSGVVAEIDYPEFPLTCKSGSEAATPLFDKLINIDRKDNQLSSFQLKFGFRDENYFVSYILSGFETRKIQLRLPTQKKYISLEISEFPLLECGLRIILDINNKPKSVSNGIEKDIDLIFKKEYELFVNINRDLNLEGLLK